MTSNQANSVQSKLNGIAITACFVVLMFAFLVSKGDAGVYPYKDENGKIHSTDNLANIPQEYRESEKGMHKHKEALKDPGPITMPTVPSPIQIASVKVPGRQANANKFQIPLIAKGNSYYVDVLLNGGVSVRLLLDTGASDVTLSADVAKKWGFSIANVNAKTTSNTANGEAIFANIALHTVEVGKAKSYLVEAGFNDSYNNNDGLMGMSFLGEFRFEIDRS